MNFSEFTPLNLSHLISPKKGLNALKALALVCFALKLVVVGK